jgi:uncharacterized YigZ family protein
VEDKYKTIEHPCEGIYKDRGSKFLAYAYPAQDEEQAVEILKRLKKEHHTARHHCYAWRFGTGKIRERINDDGEPSSTAGRPILGQLKKFGLTNIFVVVVRYFGGTLLGTGGLIKAYKRATADALGNARIVTRTIEIQFNVYFNYPQMNDVMHLIRQENLTILNTKFELTCELTFSVRQSQSGAVEKMFRQLPGVTVSRS